ncbi:hypothetical protein N0V93_006095 [Gnomoniopsis smithogilvyi]|uniref:Uncharacterized protein n=1 Tax=Gnomoniopsis smithogilvyi TaxID=1191159 RepID=A0A9W8YNZ5_9PEZI|nr:hypothetical protein N0V93_006095 [Gnomoniopsis smithogilvyi]
MVHIPIHKHEKATHGRTVDRQRAEELISGRMPSLAPSPRSIGFTRRSFQQRTISPPRLQRPDTTYTMPDRLVGRGDDQPASRMRCKLARAPSVIVIDDSEEEDEYEGNRQPRFGQGIGYSIENQHDSQGQEDHSRRSTEQNGQYDHTGELQQAQLKEESSSSPHFSDDGEEQPVPEGQSEPLQDTREQTPALLDLPEVNIPIDERVETPRALVCELLAHQRVGLTWLIRQEEDPEKRGSILAGKKTLIRRNTPKIMANSLTICSSDGMGLGKTIEALGLIVSRRSDPADPFRRTTLIVAPLGLLPQWKDEIHKKVTLRHGRKLSAAIFHGSASQHMTIGDLLQFDIVLCTYGKLISEYNMYTKGPRHKCKLLSRAAKFYRVILDEAHFIKNKDTQSSKAVCQLQAVHRLCMTGTPLMNNVTELYPLIRFLGIQPYNVWNMFSEHIDRPVRQWAPGMETPAMLTLQKLVKNLMLRRSKDSRLDGERIINLGERVDIEIHVEFDDEQQLFYDALKLSQKLKFNKYLKAGIVMKKYLVILTWLLRLRQACNHPYLLQNHCIPDVCALDAEGMINLALQLPIHVQESLKAIRHFRCPKCTDPSESVTENPVIISPCGHYLCAECYSSIMEEADFQRGGIANIHGKIRCLNGRCSSIITPDNVLMHNFFVDAQKGAGVDIQLSDKDESPEDEKSSDNEGDMTESESEDDAEIDSSHRASPRNPPAPFASGQREPSCGLFVDSYSNESGLQRRGDSFDGGASVSEDERPRVIEEQARTRKFGTPRAGSRIVHRFAKPISRAPSGGYSISRSADTSSLAQSVARPFYARPPTGVYGNSINLVDEEEDAAFSTVSQQLAATGSPGNNRHEKFKGVKAEESQEFIISNYDGPSSPSPRFKRKGGGSERPNSTSKRSRSGRPQPNLSRLSSRKSSYHMYVDSDDEEGAFASPNADRANIGDFDHTRLPQGGVTFGSLTRDSVVGFDDSPQSQGRFPKFQEEKIKPDVHRMGQMAREVLQRPFVSLSNKRQIADQSKRAMAAYQKRIASEWVASAKTEKIMDILKMIKRKHRGEKTLIFSLWTVFLDLLEPPLRKAGFKYTVYTGGMKTDNRTAAIQTFMTNPELDVMLISLSAGSCGLNLTAANHVILTEPFWNPFVEEQAIDRTHRLGQEKTVFVYRLLIKGTIEDYIVRLQRRKKNLVGAVLCDAQNDSPLNKLTLEELKTFFGV